MILRPFQHSDAADMFKNWASDPDVTEFLTWSPHADNEATKAVLCSWIDRYSAPLYFNWAMELKDEGEIIGNISVVKLEGVLRASAIHRDGDIYDKAYYSVLKNER